MSYVLDASLDLPLPRGRVFDFFAAAENLGRHQQKSCAARLMYP